MITFKQKGDYAKATKYLEKLNDAAKVSVLERYAQAGVNALASATPVESGLTAASWYYEIEIQNGLYRITFCNSNVVDYFPVAINLQYGHGTRNGGWVEGRDYINPAIQPIFDKIVEDAWKEVTAL